ncbi:hypothetical protein, partial [Microcoleus sp. B13-B6]|uniref:hypothetical protein n=1 Tax=Microcoleus sp. B13-B6 TaxID=2818652 RepID=UPI002FD711B7
FVGWGRVFEIVCLGRLWLVEPAPRKPYNVNDDCLLAGGGFLRLFVWGDYGWWNPPLGNHIL